jgi:aryl-alcohol dehydrogenase-like predicted oxidoreductase
MGMSDLYGPADDVESIATIHAALDAGITLIDTGDFYGSGHNEMLIRDALKQRNRDDVVISVKFGKLGGSEALTRTFIIERAASSLTGSPDVPAIDTILLTR